MLIITDINSAHSFISCLIQLIMKFFLIRRHSVSFYVILLLLFVTSCIFLQMFVTVSSVSYFSVFLTSQRYLLYAVIISYCSNFQLLIKTYSWSSAYLIFLNFVILTDVTEQFFFLSYNIIELNIRSFSAE